MCGPRRAACLQKGWYAVYPVDLILENARIYNSYFQRFFHGYLAVLEGRIFHVGLGEEGLEEFSAPARFDCGGRCLIPGLVDVHMHIESSMAAPLPFTDYLARCGVTTIVSEPHEIANVFGLEGIRAILDAAPDSAVEVLCGIPSSVPSTSAALETTGGEIGLEELKELLQDPRIACLGEVMNTRGVLNEPACKPNVFTRYLRTQAPALPLEGHCPRLKGVDLSRYLFTGIDSDHTEHDLEEVKHRYFKGMFFELQQKMMLPEVVAFIVQNRLYEQTAFVTDDTMADALVDRGHLNALAREAVRQGMPLEQAVYCASYTGARRMRLYDRGALAPGRLADMVLLSERAEDFLPQRTYKAGRLVWDAAAPAPTRSRAGMFPPHFYRSVQLSPIGEEAFRVPAPQGAQRVTVRAMGVSRLRTQTTEEHLSLPVRGGLVDWQGSGAALVCVFERHGRGGGVGRGFACGDLLQRGAVATTYAHDHHNLMAVGHSAADMALAAERVRQLGGGMAVAEGGEILAEIPLPVAGLMSEEPMEVIGSQLREVQLALRRLGYRHYEPVMSLCTLSLPVSPALKITDKGLVDVAKGAVVPLFCEG